MRMSSLLKTFTISLGLSSLVPLSAVGGTITFFDLSDNVTVTLSPDLIARGSTSTSLGEVATVHLVPPIFPNGGTSWANTTILEPGPGQVVSDTITDVPTFDPNFNILSFLVTFTSNVEGGPPLPNLGNTIVENGTIQEAISSGIHWPNGIVDRVFFQSDIEGGATPEPASLALIGLASFSMLRRRR